MQGCSVAPFLTVITVKLHTYLIGYYHFGKTIQASIVLPITSILVLIEGGMYTC